MSGTAAVGNTFASAVTATGLQLDNNFSTIVAYLNDPTNRNNYASDGGTTNTVVPTFAPPVVGGYTAGLELTWKWAATPTGGTVLNANGFGNINVVNPDGSALQAGQGTQGSIGKAVYDGTRAIFLAPPSPATKAAMQTATASATFVAPAQVVNHPGVAKVWLNVAQSGGTYSLLDRYNVASIGRAGTGTITINFSVTLSTTTYPAVITSGNNNIFAQTAVKTPTSCVIRMANAAASAAIDSDFSFAVFGTL